jgi:copper chaperone CopZ
VTISGTHLCCGKCVTAAEKAIQAVPGVKSHTATKGAESFKVEGDFNEKELMASLQKSGFSGKVTR